MRVWGIIATAALLGGCSGGLIPPAAGPAPAPARTAHRPPPATESRPEIPPAAHRTASNPPARQPTPATPITARPVAGSVGTPGGTAPTTATDAGILPGPALATLPVTDEAAGRALAAYRSSCRALVTRTDQSGLTRGSDWQPSCDAAQQWQTGNARQFFQRYFETAQIGDGQAFATGYFEPEIRGSRTRRHGYDVPVYGLPADLIEADLGRFSDDLAGRRICGRVDGRAFVPYYDRAAIEEGALAGRGLEIAWAADPIEFFFLQIQGSGRLRLPDGSVMRIGYAGQNGQAYTGIGGLMRDRGLLAPGQASMQGIMAWLREHPGEGRAIMRENKSWVFFRELTGPGPLGALGYPVAGQVSAAADPRFVPLGAPVFLSLDRADATGLWVVQDTGGAIRGANRFDTFWGAGDDARAIAGGMSARGTAFLLLPVGSVARLSGS